MTNYKDHSPERKYNQQAAQEYNSTEGCDVNDLNNTVKQGIEQPQSNQSAIMKIFASKELCDEHIALTSKVSERDLSQTKLTKKHTKQG